MTPTADHVARAIVAACRETGDNPIAVASKRPNQRARHYAWHALAKVFPDADRDRLAVFVGCAKSGNQFWRNSCRNVADPVGLSSYSAHWWRNEAWERVCAAIMVEDRPAPAPEAPEPAPKPVLRAKEPPRRHETIDAVKPARTPHSTRPSAHAEPGKLDLYRMLGEAVKNTARMAPKAP